MLRTGSQAQGPVEKDSIAGQALHSSAGTRGEAAGFKDLKALSASAKEVH